MKSTEILANRGAVCQKKGISQGLLDHKKIAYKNCIQTQET